MMIETTMTMATVKSIEIMVIQAMEMTIIVIFPKLAMSNKMIVAGVKTIISIVYTI